MYTNDNMFTFVHLRNHIDIDEEIITTIVHFKRLGSRHIHKEIEIS